MNGWSRMCRWADGGSWCRCETGERIDVLPDRTAQTVTTWLREHPGAQHVCRDGSATYAESIRQALPEAVQVSDRWHLWSNLCGKALAEARSHAACWATVVNPTRPGGVREQRARIIVLSPAGPGPRLPE